MSIADRPRAEIVERLRVTEAQLVVTTQRAESAEHQLDAANKRLLDYESEIAAVCPEDLSLKETIESFKREALMLQADREALLQRAEAAERRLATEIRQNVMREMASKGGIKGAATLNAKLTPEERKASASKAAKARWANSAGGKQ